MKFKNFRTMALLSTAIAGIIFIPLLSAKAADNADVTVDLATDAGITVTKTRDMDFGSWIIGVHAGDSPSITMAASDGAYTKSLGVNSDLVELTADTNGTTGQLLVVLPAGADGLTVQMTKAATTDFDPTSNLSLTAVTYYNSDDNTQTGTLVDGTAVPILITTGATGATVSFGGTITASDTPPDNVSTGYTATFNVAFAY